MDRLRQGVAAHLPIGNRHRRTELFAGDVLESLERLLGIVQRARFLVGPRQPKLRRSMQRIQLQRRLVLHDGVLKVLILLIAAAQQIMRIRIVRIDRNGLLEIFDCFRSVSVLARDQAKVVPGSRVLRVLCNHLAQHGACLRQLLRIEQRDSLIQLRNQQRRIFFDGGRKQLLSSIEVLLIHVGHAEIVQLNGVYLGGMCFDLAPGTGGDEKKNGENLGYSEA